MKLWYSRPAACWTEALPGGNGRIGAMLVGNPAQERIDLNEDTFWSGYPRRLENVDTAEVFQKIRELIFQRRYREAEELFEDKMSFAWGESYEPLGALKLDFGGMKAENYRRALNLDDALLSVDFRANGVHYARELLVSAPNQVLALKLSADRPGSISFEATMDAPIRHAVQGEEDVLWMRVQAPSLVEPNYSNALEEPVQYSTAPGEQGVRAWVAVQIRHDGGSLRCEKDRLCLEGADSAVILVAARTSFRSYDAAPDTPDEEVRARCMDDLAGADDYEALRERHVMDHRTYMQRVRFELGEDEGESVPTDERLRRFDPAHPDCGLYPLLFQYGRYLLIAGSRPGTQALNLQGIWNSEVRPPWSSNYTININTQMNYWPALPCALEEMQLPLIDLVCDLARSGRETARMLYRAPGFVSHHNTDLWRFTWPVGNRTRGCVGYAFWNMSGAWLCGQLFERYEYTLDANYLRGTAYPVMRAAAEFVLSLLADDGEGNLIVSPATSPENGFLIEGRHTATDRTSAMSMALARELFGNCVKACEVLDEDGDFAQRLRETIAKLRPDGIGADGRLLEYFEEHEEDEPHHRHLSHLYGVHPGNRINREDEPALMDACRRSLEGRGAEGTGWSLAWKVSQWARHGEGDRALNALNMQLRLVEGGDTHYSGGGSYVNLFCAHPPFQIDGNFGVAAGISEMLQQSRPGRLLILPALPKEWKRGSVHGLCARGCIRTEIDWNGDEGSARLRSDVAQTVRVSVGRSGCIDVQLTPGREAILTWKGAEVTTH